MSPPLQRESTEFADRLSRLIAGCVPDAPSFGVVETGRAHERRIGPLPFRHEERGFGFVALPRACDEADAPRLMLRIEFRVSLDDESDYLAVQHSTYGLWVRPDPNRRPRPVFRIEYDRGARCKPAAHVHLHAE